jgi:hormone-sensitive lipase
MEEGILNFIFRFVSYTSKSHQSYTRKWANSVKIPVFSVDYKKVPENLFPVGLNDCWQTYNWILN